MLATFPVDGRREVEAAVARADEAAAWWAGLGWSERRIRLLAWKSHLTRYLTLAQLVHEETGKPLDDAKLEIILAIVHIDWAARHARRVLRPRRVRSGLAAINQASTVEYQPLGVVGVIGPWNYPVFTPVGHRVRAGGRERGPVQAVRADPGDRGLAGPGVQRGAGDLRRRPPVLQVITGPGSTGDRWPAAEWPRSRSRVRRPTRKVMAAAADTLTPVLAECGGKDAMLVSADADLEAAADAAAWGAMSNAGQTCIGIERVYVARGDHDFLEQLTSKVSSLRPGFDSEASSGPMTLPSQPETVAKHVADALALGGRPVVGGPDAVAAPYVRPVVLTEVPEGSAAVTEETFGPTVTVTAVAGLDEAVSFANAGRYGLGSAVFTRDRSAAMTAARSLRSGMTSINSVLGFAIVPALPFGGMGESGFGRIHGADGLREFTRPKAITRQRMRPLINLTSFGRTEKDMRRIVTLVTLLHGRLYRPRGGRRAG